MKTKITLLCLLAFLCIIPKAAAQCTVGTQRPTDTYQATNVAGNATINTDAKLGEYARVHVVPDKRYTFSTSVATDYITVTNSDGSQILASGVAPLYYFSVYDEAVRYYIHQNAQCQTANLFSRTRYLSWAVAPPCLDPIPAGVSNITPISCTVSLIAPSVAPAFGYEVHVSTSQVGPQLSVETHSSTTNSIFVSNLNPDTTYYYWLRSDCTFRKGEWVYGGSFTTISSLICNSAYYGLYPDATFTPACTGTDEIFSDDSRNGSYSNIAVTANTRYTFRTDWEPDFITITNALGTVVLTSGLGPVTWNSGGTSGVVRFFVHANAQCGLGGVSLGLRSKYVKCTTTSVTCLPPTNLAVSNITSNSCRLAWTAPAAAPGSGYEIYMSTNNNAPGVTTTATLTSATAGVGTINGLTAGLTYYYWIRSNCGSDKSTWASGGSFTVNASLSCNGAIYGLYPNATFTPACSGSAEQIASDSWAGEYSNVNASANKQYTFTSSVATDYITITNAAGTTVLASGITPLSWTSGTTTGLIRYHLNTNASCGTQNTNRTRSIKCADVAVGSCGAPTALSVSNITSNSIRLNWAAPATAPASYDLYIITTNTAPTAATAATVTSATAGVGVLTGLNAATTFYYWIRSNCGTSKSAWAAGGNFTTLAALVCNGAINGLYPDATYTPVCSGIDEQIVTNSWGGEYTNVNILANKRYTFTSSVTTDYLTITNAAGTAVLASGLTPVTWTSGTAAVIRYYLHTNANCGTQNTSRTRSIKCSNATIGCGLPTNLAVSNITSNSFRITWIAPSPAPNSGYELYVVSNSTAPTGNTIATHVSLTNSTWVLSGFSGGTNYNYWVRANCGSSKGDWVYGGSFDTVPALNCNGATFGLFPEDAIQTACNGSNEVISDVSRAGEYSNVYINFGLRYTFTSSIATDYITITNDSGTMIYASGLTPLNWSSGSNVGMIRYYIHSNSACGDQSQPIRVKSIKCTTILGVDDQISDNEIIMYPNPSAGQFTVETANVIADNIVVFDNLGRIISTHKPNWAKTTLAIDGFSDGIYYVKINYQDKNVTKKLVLKKN